MICKKEKCIFSFFPFEKHGIMFLVKVGEVMDRCVPDIYQKSIYTIDYKKLKQLGIKCLIFDLNNTMAPLNLEIPDKNLRDLFAYLESLKFKLIILSNDSKSRVEPFKEKLNVDAAFKSKKPSKKKYQKILDLYHLQVHEVASIGDQLITDIFGANSMGFTTILVNPISHIDHFSFGNILDRYIYRYLKRKGLLEVGTYYD